MARRGSLVGDAYVRIHADSSAVDRELREEMKAAAKAGSDELIADFDKAIRQKAKQRLRGANEAILDGIVGGKKDWDRQFKQSGLSLDEFAKTVESRMKRIAGATGGKGFKTLQKSLDDFSAWATDARVVEGLERMRKAVADQDKAWRSYSGNLAASAKLERQAEAAMRKTEKAILDQDRAFNSYADNIDPVRRMTRAIKEQEKAFATYSKNVAAAMDFNFDTAIAARMRKAAREANEALVRGIVGGKAEWDKQFKASGEKSVKDFAKRIKKELRDAGTAAEAAGTPFRELGRALREIDVWAKGNSSSRLDRFTRSVRNGRSALFNFADLIGKAFGKGSRNNFFNFTGAVAGGIATIGAALTSGAIGAIGGALKTVSVFGGGAIGIMKGIGQLMGGGGGTGITTALFDFTDGIKDLASSLGGALLSAAKTVIPVLAAVGGAIALGAIAIPPLLAGIANLAAIVTAVAGTISVGLVGALLVAGPLLAAVAGGIGTAILLLAGFKDETKKVAKAIKPLSDAWKEFKKRIQGPVLEKVAKAFSAFAPLLKGFITTITVNFANAIAGAAKHMADLFNSKKFAPFLKIWEKELPDIFGNLAHAISTLAPALIAFFTPILPYAQQLADNLMFASQTFYDWITSAKGQNAVADFMKTAWERAGDLWDIIVLVGQALSGLLTSGDENGGDTIIDAIKKKLQDFVTWINGDGAAGLKQWFQNGVDTAKSLWQSIGDIADALKAVDWQDASDNINTVVEWLGKMVSAGLLLIAGWNTWTAGMGAGWNVFAGIFRSIYDTIIGPIISLMLGGIASVQRALALMLGALGNVTGWEWAKDASRDLYAAADATDQLSEKLRTLPDPTIWINVGIRGEGARVLRGLATGKNKFAEHRANVIFGMARGGILGSPTFIRPNVVAGEAGREAVVPLDRPLSQIDPSVRALAAFAQGMSSLKSGGILGGGGTTIEAGAIVVQAPYSDGRLVAESVFDHLAAAAR